MEAKWSSATPQSSDLGSRPCLGKPRLLPSKGSFELSSTDLPLIEGATELQCASGCTTLIPGRSQTVWVHCCCWAGRRTGPVAFGRFEGSAGLERAWNRAVFYSRSVSQLEIGLYYYCHWLALLRWGMRHGRASALRQLRQLVQKWMEGELGELMKRGGNEGEDWARGRNGEAGREGGREGGREMRRKREGGRRVCITWGASEETRLGAMEHGSEEGRERLKRTSNHAAFAHSDTFVHTFLRRASDKSVHRMSVGDGGSAVKKDVGVRVHCCSLGSLRRQADPPSFHNKTLISSEPSYHKKVLVFGRVQA